MIQCHTLIQIYVKPNTNAIWQEIDLEDLASNAGKKTAARETMLSKLGNNQMDIGFDDRITSTSDAVDKHNSHPSVMKIRQQYGNESTFRFNLVDENCVALTLRNITPRNATGYDHIPGKIVRIAHQELSFPITRLINTAITANAFPSNMKFTEISPGHKKMIIF